MTVLPGGGDAAAASPDADLSIARFARELWGIAAPTDWAEFSFIRKDAEGKEHLRTFYERAGDVIRDYDRVSLALAAPNAKGWNVHHGVNPRRRSRGEGQRGKNEDVEYYVAVWADCDWHTASEAAVRAAVADARQILAADGIAPSIEVESGYGLHDYYLLQAPAPVEAARRICAGLMDLYKVSDAIHDPSRLLRWPGTWNVKVAGHPKECRIAAASWRRYSLEQLQHLAIDVAPSCRDQAEEAERKEAAASTATVAAGRPSRDPKIEEVKRDGVDEGRGAYGGRHNAAKALAGHYAATLRTKKAITAALEEWNRSRCRPPIEDKQIAGLVEYAWTQEQIKRADRAAEKANTPPPPPTIEDEEEEIRRRYFKGREFCPEPLARELMDRYPLLASPKGDDGIGVRIYVYRDGAYRVGGEDLIMTESARALGLLAKHDRTTSVVRSIRNDAKVDEEELNRKAKELINVRNGMLRWRTGDLLPHAPDYRSTLQIEAEWTPQATSEVLDDFLQAVFPVDVIPLFEEFLGYLLIPETALNKCLVLMGPGGNGKTTVMDLIEGFLGERNISHFSLQHFTDEKFSAAGLVGKLANFYDELQTRQIRDTATFKIVTGGSPLKAEEKGKAPFWFRPFCRLVFSANEMPHADDRSQAYFDRFLFIRMPNRIRGTRGEVFKYAHLLLETPGVRSALLRRAIDGLRRLMSQGRFSASSTSQEATEEYRRECNSAYDFIQESCTFDDPTGWIAKQELYDRYRVWCAENNRKPMSSRGFGKSVEGLNVRSVRHGDARGWGGIGWGSGGPPEGEVTDFVNKMKRDGNLDF